MNRPAVGPQTLRGIPSQYSNQQQIPQNRVPSRIQPGGKMPSNGSSWAFGAGMPMGGGAGLNSRPTASMASFAQAMTGSSQSQTPLDLSEFPSLSGNQPQRSQSTWAAPGSRNIGLPGNMHMQQQSALSSQQQLNSQQQTQQQQDDLFSSSSQLPSSQAAFRFGQTPVGQSSQSNATDEFPPLNRNANGDIGQDRIQNIGFGGPPPNGMGFGSVQPSQPSRNGLLNALSISGGSRVPSSNRVASPASLSGVSNSRSPTESNRQGLGGISESEASAFMNNQFPSTMNIGQREGSIAQSNMTRPDGPSRDQDSVIPRSQTMDSASQSNVEESGPEVQDVMAGMNEIDKWGLKGFTFMMTNFPDYAAMVAGENIGSYQLDLNSENLSSQTYSLFNDEPPRPSVPRFTLPECYTVTNIAALDTKLSNFNEEALIFMFYTNPGDIQQILAATELNVRNWRFHKKLQLWLTKDDTMLPQPLGNGTERGYYIFFDIKTWSKDRRELTLVYEDLENTPAPMPPLTRLLV